MNWPREYLARIQSGERECAWMDDETFPFRFDEKAGERPVRFVEMFCRNSKGKWAGKPLVLDLFQKAKIQLVFGWLDRETGKRRFREVVDIRGRKNGKSVETAAIELYMLTADGEGGAEIYCTANKLDQAKLIFDEAVNMRAQSAVLRESTRKRVSDIYYPDTFSTLKALAADTKTMDGLNAHFFSQDEFHEARDSKIYDVMVQSQSARDQPLAWLISTNGYVRESFFDSKMAYCEKVARWEFQDYRLLPLLYRLDVREEWMDPACWMKANPGLGTIKNLDTLRENVEKAKRDPSFLPTVLTKDFNIPENTNAAWLPYEACVNETVVPMEYLTDTYAVGGCDLSAVRDLTCSTLLIQRPDDPNYYVLQHYFLPRSRVDALEQTGNREAPYRLWEEQGWLTLSDGAAVDFRQVTEWFLEMLHKHKISPLWIGYDRALSGYWVQDMKAEGFEMQQIAQGPFSWSYSMKQMGALLEEKRIVYQNNPVTRWCLHNTGVKTLNRDGIQTIQPVKTSDNKRIDGMVSMLNAFTCLNKYSEEYKSYVR